MTLSDWLASFVFSRREKIGAITNTCWEKTEEPVRMSNVHYVTNNSSYENSPVVRCFTFWEILSSHILVLYKPTTPIYKLVCSTSTAFISAIIFSIFYPFLWWTYNEKRIIRSISHDLWQFLTVNHLDDEDFLFLDVYCSNYHVNRKLSYWWIWITIDKLHVRCNIFFTFLLIVLHSFQKLLHYIG